MKSAGTDDLSKLGASYRAPLTRPDSAKKLIGDVYYRVRREPGPKSREKPTVWVDVYIKKNWTGTMAATSATLMFLDLQKDIAFGLFMIAAD